MSPDSELIPAVLPMGGTVDLMPEETVERLFKMAGFLAKSRMFKDVTQAEQAFAKMLVGYHLGLNPSQSMMGIQIVRGNVGMSYPLMGAFIKSRSGYDYKILEHDDLHAKIEFIKDGETVGTASFSVEDAKRAKLVKSDGGWETYPENMCVARALSKGIRFFMPEALGGLPVYATDEIPAATALDELTAGEGSGEEPDVELPQDVLNVIADAIELDAPGWADVSTWKYRVKLGGGTLNQSLEEATRDLNALRAKREEEIKDAEVVEPDVPIDTEGLPDSLDEDRLRNDSQNLGGGEAPAIETLPQSTVSTSEPSVAQEPKEVLVLRRKREIIEEMPADSEEEQDEKDEALAYVDAQIEQILEQVEPEKEGSRQESLL